MAPPRRFVDPATAPADDGNYRVISRVVRELIDTGNYDDADAEHDDLPEAAKCRCAELGIDYSDLQVIYRAIVSERFKRWERTQPAPDRRRPRRR